jgi:hypothetical protein
MNHSRRLFNISILVVFTLALFLLGCNEEKKAWKIAKTTNTENAYDEFISKYPSGKYVSSAREAEEQIAWISSEKVNSEDSYNKFLTKYPSGKFASEARRKGEALSWESTKKTNTVATLQKFITLYPKSLYLAEAQGMLEKVKYIPSRETLESCLREAIRTGGPGSPVGSGWKIVVSIKKIGKYDKAKGYLRVDGGGMITDGYNQYYVIPAYFKVTTDGNGKWSAKYID